MSDGNGGGAGGSAGGQGTFTKTELLASLRAVESRLYSPEVEARVRALSDEQKQQFVAARLHLTAVIARLNASLMQDIREALDRQAPALRQGIADLSGSLGRLQGASQWAGAVRSVIGLLGKVVPLL